VQVRVEHADEVQFVERGPPCDELLEVGVAHVHDDVLDPFVGEDVEGHELVLGLHVLLGVEEFLRFPDQLVDFLLLHGVEDVALLADHEVGAFEEALLALVRKLGTYLAVEHGLVDLRLDDGRELEFPPQVLVVPGQHGIALDEDPAFGKHCFQVALEAFEVVGGVLDASIYFTVGKVYQKWTLVFFVFKYVSLCLCFTFLAFHSYLGVYF